MQVEYSSNNSGGSWWLDDGDWHALEDAGWDVEWIADQGRYDGDRWLGALAKRATVSAESPADAIRSFEKVTGQDASAQGCNCCGPPHIFRWETEGGERGYASGPDVLNHLYDDVPHNLREATERLN